MRRALSAALITFAAAGALLAGPPSSAEPAADQPASTFTPRAPVRVLDTRTGTGPVGAGGTITLDLAAQVPATATAVVLNVTGVTPTAPTFITVFPAGAARPTASSLNLVAGDIRANQVTVALSADRRISLYNNAGNTHIVADLAGHYATGAGAKFTALPSSRLLDTRTDTTPLGPGGTRVLDLANRVPASATALTFNLTAANPTAATFVTAWPTGATRPNASNLNITAGDTRPNLVTVAIGADRKVSLYNNAGTVDVLVDLTGFYTPAYGASFIPMDPTRVLDTRDGTGGSTGPVGPGGQITLDLAARLPLTATGVLLNVTGVDATAATYVTAWPTQSLQTNASTLNLSAGQTTPNAAAVSFGFLRGVQFYNHAGSVHLVADLAGVFAVVGEAPCVADCVYSWGDNANKELGTAEARPTSWQPTPVVTLSGVRAVDGAGQRNAYALRADGTVWAWGNNESGQLGNGWASAEAGGFGGGSAVPVPVVGLANATAIAGSTHGAYALRADGTVWAWGAGWTGRLGNGGLTDASTPVQVSGLTNVIAISGGWGTGYALRADGTVWSWGYNGTGALGDGSTVEYSPVPVQVSGLTAVTAIAGRDNGGYALRADGTVRAWGANSAGQLGDGQPCAQPATCGSHVPVQVSGLTRVTGVAGGINNGYAVRNDGTVWAWGSPYQGALGDGTECPVVGTCESRVPVQVAGITNATQVAGFDFGGYALRADGSVSAWGANTAHALGNIDVPGHSAVPVPVVGVDGVSAVGAGWETGFAIVPNPGD